LSADLPLTFDNITSSPIFEVNTWPFLQVAVLKKPHRGKTPAREDSFKWIIEMNESFADVRRGFIDNQRLWVTFIFGIGIAIVTSFLTSLLFGEDLTQLGNSTVALMVAALALGVLICLFYSLFVPTNFYHSVAVKLAPFDFPPGWYPGQQPGEEYVDIANANYDYPDIIEKLVFIVSQCKIREAVSKAHLNYLQVREDRSKENYKPSTLLQISLRKERHFFKPNVLRAIVNEFQALILQLGLI
jgi:hypothetical protein